MTLLLPFKTKVSLRRHAITNPFIASLMLLLAACATRNSSTEGSNPGAELVAVRRNVTDALNAAQSMLDALGALNDESGHYTPELLTRFATNVNRLQIDSFSLRAHSRAMRSRGDAYFQQWQEHFANAYDPQVWQFAGEHRQTLQHSLDTIQGASEQTREALQLFISDVQRLERALEKKSSGNTTNFTKEFIKARDDGQKVRQNLVAVRHELDAMISNLTPAKKSAQQ